MIETSHPPLKFGIDEVQQAHAAWRFNCGPAALCAILGMTPDELRPHLLDFEQRGYTSPTLMAGVLCGLKVPFRRLYECQHQVAGRPLSGEFPQSGLVRVQWGGPWTKPGVPIRVRYRHTHWVAMRRNISWHVFDINAIGVGGWLPSREWSKELVPWLIREAVPRADGSWWPTHCWDVG